MSFGRNPYLAKAQAAELKASDAPDPIAQARAYREAAHEWDRAASREPPGKRRVEYEQSALRNRELADGDARAEDGEKGEGVLTSAALAGKPLMN